MRILRAALVLSMLGVALVPSSTGALARPRERAAPTPARAVPGSGCRVFPRDSIWNARIDALPVHDMSDTWLASSNASSTDLHPDFGPPRYGMPFAIVDRRHPRVEIRFTYAAQSDPGPYPFDASTPVEGGTDRHVLIVQRRSCKLFELFAARWNGGAPRAGSGAIWDLDSNRLRPEGWTSADAAGLPILPGLVRWDEVEAGSIRHAIRFTVGCTTQDFVWPARHQAGVADPDCPPMGARFRLRSDFDLSGFSPKARTILLAMQRYGLILADNGSDWYFQGTRNARWRNGLLDQLKTVPASAFEAVDTSACMVRPDSGKADCAEA
jgi:hypothetical protein